MPDEEAEPPVEGWIDEYYDELEELYSVYRRYGKQLFGGAFDQFGNFGDFCIYVRDRTIF